MDEQFDSKFSYDVYDAQDFKCGVIIDSVFEWFHHDTVGTLMEGKLLDGDRVIGQLEGLKLLRLDPPSEARTYFKLVKQDR